MREMRFGIPPGSFVYRGRVARQLGGYVDDFDALSHQLRGSVARCVHWPSTGRMGTGLFHPAIPNSCQKKCKGLRFPDRSTTTDLPTWASFWCVGLTIRGHPVSYTVFRFELMPAVVTIGCMHACTTLLRALGLTALSQCRNITVLNELFLMSACLRASVCSDLRKRMYKTGFEVAFDA